MSVPIGEIITLLNTAGQVAAKAIEAYNKARELASKTEGVSPRDIADADARWLRVYEDPLKPEPGTEPAQPAPNNGDMYEKWMDDPGDERLLANDYVYGHSEDERVFIHRNGPMTGFPGGPEFLVRVVGG